MRNGSNRPAGTRHYRGSTSVVWHAQYTVTATDEDGNVAHDTYLVRVTSPSPTQPVSPTPTEPPFVCLGGTPIAGGICLTPTPTQRPAASPIVSMPTSGAAGQVLDDAAGYNWVAGEQIIVKFDNEIIDTFTPARSSWQRGLLVPFQASLGAHEFTFEQYGESYIVHFTVIELPYIVPSLKVVTVEDFAFCPTTLFLECKNVELEVSGYTRTYVFSRSRR